MSFLNFYGINYWENKRQIQKVIVLHLFANRILWAYQGHNRGWRLSLNVACVAGKMTRHCDLCLKYERSRLISFWVVIKSLSSSLTWLDIITQPNWNLFQFYYFVIYFYLTVLGYWTRLICANLVGGHTVQCCIYVLMGVLCILVLLKRTRSMREACRQWAYVAHLVSLLGWAACMELVSQTASTLLRLLCSSPSTRLVGGSKVTYGPPSRPHLRPAEGQK